MKGNRTIRIIIIVLSVLLAVSLFALGETLSKCATSENTKDTAVAQDNFITDEKTSETAEAIKAETIKSEKISGTAEAPNPAGKTQTIGAKCASIANILTRPIHRYLAGCCAYASSNEITLSGADPSENVRFELKNMFPGDSETKIFRVKVKHNGKVKVHCEAAVNTTGADAANLGKAIKVRVKVGKEGMKDEELYDGILPDMPDKAVYTLSGYETTELTYTITAYIDTSAGNEFQNKSIQADFKWWLEDVTGGGGRYDKDKTDDDPDKDKTDQDKDNQDKTDDKPSKDDKDDKKDNGKDNTKGDKDGKETGKKGGIPKTGDSQDLFLWIGLAALTGGGTIFLIGKKRQKDGDEND